MSPKAIQHLASPRTRSCRSTVRSNRQRSVYHVRLTQRSLRGRVTSPSIRVFTASAADVAETLGPERWLSAKGNYSITLRSDISLVRLEKVPERQQIRD